MYANACTQSQTCTCKHPLYPDTIYVTPAASWLKLVPWSSLSTSLGHTVGVLQSKTHVPKSYNSNARETDTEEKVDYQSEHSCYPFCQKGVYLFWALLLYILPRKEVSVLRTATMHFAKEGGICHSAVHCCLPSPPLFAVDDNSCKYSAKSIS